MRADGRLPGAAEAAPRCEGKLLASVHLDSWIENS